MTQSLVHQVLLAINIHVLVELTIKQSFPVTIINMYLYVVCLDYNNIKTFIHGCFRAMLLGYESFPHCFIKPFCASAQCGTGQYLGT